MERREIVACENLEWNEEKEMGEKEKEKKRKQYNQTLAVARHGRLSLVSLSVIERTGRMASVGCWLSLERRSTRWCCTACVCFGCFVLFSFDSHLVAEGGHLLVLLVILVIPVDILLVLCFCQRLEKGGYLLVVAGAAKVDELVLIIFIGASVPVLYRVSYLDVLFVYLVCCLDLKG